MNVRDIMLTALVTAVAGCTTVSSVQVPPGDYLRANAPGRAWATLDDGSQMVIDGPRVISDTIFGWSEGDEIAIPVEDVDAVRVRQVSVVRSLILPTAIAGGVVAAATVLKTDGTATVPRDSSQENEFARLPRP